MVLADFSGFDGICVDLGWDDLKRLTIGDRFKLFFCWIWKISLDSCKNVNEFGWVLEDLADFERL